MLTPEEIVQQFPNAHRVLMRALVDPEMSGLLDTIAETWREQGELDVLAERERCAVLAEHHFSDCTNRTGKEIALKIRGGQ